MTISVNLDIGSIVNSIVWPILAGILLVKYRDNIGSFLKEISPRINSLSIGPFSVGLAEQKGFTPETAVPGLGDFAKTGISGGGSGISNLQAMLGDTSKVDYVVFNLGEGKNWISSRLYLFTRILLKMRGVKGVVFLENLGGIGKKFVGFADSNEVKDALSQKYPWLEAAFAEEYENMITQNMIRVGDSMDSLQAFNLLQNFVGNPHVSKSVNLDLSSSFNPAPVDSLVTFTVPVRAEATGYVNFYDGTKIIGNYVYRDKNTGKAELTTNALSIGLHVISAVYQEGDNKQCSSISKIVKQVIIESQLPPVIPPISGATIPEPIGNSSGVNSLHTNGYVYLESQKAERAEWIDKNKLERILGDSLKRSWINQRDLIGKSKKEQAKLILSFEDAFLALVDDDRRFERLIDRQKLVNEAAKNSLE